ncbi:MAG: hypothetical protein AAF532_17305 [Planctomycetota bacterium]
MADGFIRTAALVACLSVIGCGEGVFGGSTLDKLGMNAADYFKDAEVIALCEAVERGDLAEVEALIDSGSDVTAIGRHGVTPLLWAYPDDRPAIFEALLKAGADPNVKLTADLGDGQWFNKGDSVTHLCAKSRFDRHFDLVMDHGGDPNITDGRGTTALVTVIRWGRNKNRGSNAWQKKEQISTKRQEIGDARCPRLFHGERNTILQDSYWNLVLMRIPMSGRRCVRYRMPYYRKKVLISIVFGRRRQRPPTRH